MKGDIRQFAFPGYELRDYIAEAIDFLRENEPKEGYFVGFSGGKDSIVTLELCRMAGVRHQAFYSCTRMDPPEVMRFIHENYPEVTWLYPRLTMWEGIQKKITTAVYEAVVLRCAEKGPLRCSPTAPSRLWPTG